MSSFRIKRRCQNDVDAKAELRAYVDQLPIDQQRAFVLMAAALISARGNHPHASSGAGARRAALERLH